jgi:hypothetical protein
MNSEPAAKMNLKLNIEVDQSFRCSGYVYGCYMTTLMSSTRQANKGVTQYEKQISRKDQPTSHLSEKWSLLCS